MENNILTDEEIEEMTLEEKEDNLKRLKDALRPYHHIEE